MARIKQSRILIDVDDVIVKHPFLNAINDFTGKKYDILCAKNYFLQDELLNVSESEGFLHYLIEKDIYENCELMEYTKEILKILVGCMDVFPCSSCTVLHMESISGIMFARKYDFLMREFPYLDPNKIVLTGTKDIFASFDYQVDDRIDHLRGDVVHKFLFTAWHNVDISKEELDLKGIIRVNNWVEILQNIINFEGVNKYLKYWKKYSNEISKYINM